MDQAEQMARLRLIRTRNNGPMTYGLLMRRYGSATDAVAAIPAIANGAADIYLWLAWPAQKQSWN